MNTSDNTNNSGTVFEIVPPSIHDLTNGPCSQQGLFGRNSFFIGGGKENYSFPTIDELVQRAMAHTDTPDFALADVPNTKRGYRINLGVLSQLDPKTFDVPMPRVIHFVKADAPTAKVSTERLLAHDMADVMVDGLFAQPVYAFFSEDYRMLGHDKEMLAPEYWEIADSLYAQLKSAEQQVVAALPKVMTELQKRYPEASTGQLYQGALQLIGNELSPILSTVQMWTTGFRQSLDPKLKDTLVLVRAMIESNLFLSLTGNLRLDQIDAKGDIHQVIPTINVSVGDVVLPVLVGAFDSGPAVIPMHDGALGPRGGHLAFIPWNLIEVLPLINSIYMHETGHLLQSVIVGFMETYTKLIASTIASAVQNKKLVFDEPVVMIGAQKVPADKFWTMVFMGQLPELDADHWGMRTSGPGAFEKCFINYVGAMTEVAVGSMDKVDHVLRMGSSYKVVQSRDGKVSIQLEPHPQDGPRIGSWQAAIAALMGYPADSKYAVDYAASESGADAKRITWKGEVPESAKGDDGDDSSNLTGIRGFISWALSLLARKADSAAPGVGQKQPQLPTISASVADYDKVAKLIAAAFFDTKTDCLNGLSLKELVCLTPKMQKEKVDPVKDLLKKGVGTLPSDGRHYYFHTVGSAAVLALFELVEEGVDANEARQRVCQAAMSMMLALLPQWLADVKRLDIYKLTQAQVQPKSSK
jgi:hypothetical protein